MKMELTVLEDDIKEIKLIGRLDMPGTMAIDDQFTIQSATKKAVVLVDMSQVEFIASIGMRMLLANAKSLAGRGGKMVLLNPISMVNDTLTTAGISELIPIYDDRDEALADLKAALSE